MPNPEEIIRENVALVRERMQLAATRSGRKLADITLVGVTKYVDASIARQLAESGVANLGESRPQELLKKVDSLRDLSHVKWHMIGQLQRNKARKIIAFVDLIHSVDSLRLLFYLDQLATELDLDEIRILLEVNVSGDESKHGFGPEQLAAVLEQSASSERIRISGLMAMGGRDANEEDVRRQFAAVRDLRDRLAATAPANATLDHLSMGMSGDFEIGIEEGATIVRVGSSLFHGVAP